MRTNGKATPWKGALLLVSLAWLALADVAVSAPRVRGIYVQQPTIHSRSRRRVLIAGAQASGINTFVVDLAERSKYYEWGIRQLHRSGIRYVPRITVFPGGASREQLADEASWQKHWSLIEYALSLGAKEIQLDYIRYATTTEPSANNAQEIARVVRYFKERVNRAGARLQIDVFGITAFRNSLHIGQDMQLLARETDIVCPMVYPSHYEPYEEHAQQPFDTVFDSLRALQRRMAPHSLPIIAYIELFNFRVPMGDEERKNYIRAQLDAVERANVRGWYAWSANNHYDILFDLLQQPRAATPPSDPQALEGPHPGAEAGPAKQAIPPEG